MSVNHMTAEPRSRAVAIQQGRAENKRDPDVPNRTKVVRLIVVPETLNLEDRDAVRAFAMKRHAARVDTFVVNAKEKGWVPMSWLGGGLVDHHDAPRQHCESVLVLIVRDREQVQWESDVPFKIKDIAPAKHGEFPSRGKPPMPMPFDPRVIGLAGGPGRPVISGPPVFADYDQLYKVSFSMELPGAGWTDVDPDIYCDWH